MPPLPPDDAVDLFAARARAVDPNFALTDSAARVICERLDGLPLALELAAARSKLLSAGRDGRPARALARAADRRRARPARPPADAARRRSTGATSCSSPAAQALFAQLAVFRGGWTLEAAEAVAGARRRRRARRARRREPRPAAEWAVRDARDDSRVRVALRNRDEDDQAAARGALPARSPRPQPRRSRRGP